MGKSLITTDRQKKPLHHSVTGTECGGDVRVLSELLWVAAEVPEGNSVARGFTMGSMGSKSQEHRYKGKKWH